jgi:hypothetical protein
MQSQKALSLLVQSPTISKTELSLYHVIPAQAGIHS